DIKAPEGNLQHRCKKETIAGQRDRSVLLQVPASLSSFCITLNFSGSRTEKSEFDIQPKRIADLLEIQHKPRRDNTTLSLGGRVTEDPLFFSVRLKRD